MSTSQYEVLHQRPGRPSWLVGKRQSDVVVLFTSTAIQTAVQGAAPTQPDQIIIDGERYEAVHVEPWQNNVINHYRALFARME